MSVIFYLLQDLLESSASLQNKAHSHRWYDDQLQITSTFSQHGTCFYAKESAALELNRSCSNPVDLALEMLLSTTDTMSLGKLLTLDKKILKGKDLNTPINLTSLKRYKTLGSIFLFIIFVLRVLVMLWMKSNFILGI